MPILHYRVRINSQVGAVWPAPEPWGAGVDLYRTLDQFNSEYMKPLGVLNQAHVSRWSSPEMDDVIRRLKATDPTDTEQRLLSEWKA